MGKAGGIISLVAGIFAVVAAVITLAVGGVGRAVNAENAQTVVLLGWGGVLFSFAVIVLGAVAISRPSKAVGVWLIVCSVLGALLGGTLVAVLMVLSLVGGIVVLIGASPATTANSTSIEASSVSASATGEKIAELSRLATLKAEGSISGEQFAAAKSDLLRGVVREPKGVSSVSRTTSAKSSPMTTGDLARLQKMKADGILSETDFGKLAVGIVRRSESELSLDHLPLMAELKSAGMLSSEEFERVRAIIVEKQL